MEDGGRRWKLFQSRLEQTTRNHISRLRPVEGGRKESNAKATVSNHGHGRILRSTARLDRRKIDAETRAEIKRLHKNETKRNVKKARDIRKRKLEARPLVDSLPGEPVFRELRHATIR